MLNNWRMAQLHAQEAPDRVLELEEWGALFDRTKDGRILQRDFGGHRYARLAHVGDRTGLEMIRTLQQHAVAPRHRRLHGVHRPPAAARTASGSAGAVGYWRESGQFVVFKAPAVVLATGGIGKIVQDHVELVGVHRGRSRDGATGGRRPASTWSSSSSIRPAWSGRRACAASSSPRACAATAGRSGTRAASASCSDYIPDFFRAETADNEAEADRLVRGQEEQPPDARPPAARRGRAGDQRRGQGGPRQPARRRLPRHRHAPLRRLHPASACPSMYHQFKELADVDITKEPMEVGPTCHYMMGGVRVDRRHDGGGRAPRLFAAGEVAGGMHGSNRLGGNSLSDLLVVRSARRALRGRACARRQGMLADRRATRSRRRCGEVLAPVERPDRREPVRDPEGPAGGHAEPGRHHPDRVGAEGGGRRDRPSRGAGRPGARRRQPDLQSRLAPGARSPEPPCGLRGDRLWRALERKESRARTRATTIPQAGRPLSEASTSWCGCGTDS